MIMKLNVSNELKSRLMHAAENGLILNLSESLILSLQRLLSPAITAAVSQD